MQVYRNSGFTKRNYECTNVAACQLVDEGAKAPEGYIAADESVLFGMTPLWIEKGVRFWGWL